MADVTRRMLDLLATLQSGRGFSGDELARRLEVSPRTLRRDVERLRAYGYPVTTRPGPGGCYRLGAGRALPPLVLDDDEAVATLVGLAIVAATTPPDAPGGLDGAAQRAYGMIDQLLPRSLRPKARALRATLEAAPQSGPSADPRTLVLLAGAAHHHEVVTFDYEDRNGVGTHRRVEPHRQVVRHLRWYLFGWDLDRDDWRVYRVDRIGGVRGTGTSFTPRPLPADSVEDYLRTAMRPDRRRVVLTVDAPATAVADVFTWEDCAIEPLGAATSRLTTWIHSPEWLLLKLAFLDADFTVHEPQDLHAWCARFARRVLEAVSGPSPEPSSSPRPSR
ncbi:helix-turn-helix transcriptional regulator [Marinactinospora thermotolerans]|nr:YafY family protein [Marinactinospora thermotolerans]